MLRRLLARLRPSPARPAARAADAPKSGALPAMPGPRLPGPPPIGVGARRPLIAADGALAGFEFYGGAAGRSKLRRVEDEVTIRACMASVLGAMRLCIGQGLTALAEFPATWLARGDDAALCAGMVLVLAPDALSADPKALARLVARLRQAGVRVGWRVASIDVPGEVVPDFVLVGAAAEAALQDWRLAGERVGAAFPGIAQVLLDLPGLDVLEAMLHAPVVLAACVPGAAPAARQVSALSPQAARLLQLLHRLVRDEDAAALTAEIQADVALSLRLLQHADSAGLSTGHPLASVDQAVARLGRDALYRWAAQMLVRLAPARGAGQALQAAALARARLFELLARQAGDANPGDLYLFGLVSMLPALLGCSTESAVASLNLPDTALDALLRGTGPWQAYLVLVTALDRHDMAGADAAARRFGSLEQVLACATRAWLPA